MDATPLCPLGGARLEFDGAHWECPGCGWRCSKTEAAEMAADGVLETEGE